MQTTFIPRFLKQWVHPDTLLLGSALACAASFATYLGVRTLLNHTDVNIGKSSAWKWSQSAQNRKVFTLPIIKAGKIEGTTDRNTVL